MQKYCNLLYSHHRYSLIRDIKCCFCFSVIVDGSVFSVVPSVKVTVSAVRLRMGLPRMLDRDSAISMSG